MDDSAVSVAAVLIMYLFMAWRTRSWKLDEDEPYRKARERDAREAYLRRHRDHA